jgi:hypothetical protein
VRKHGVLEVEGDEFAGEGGEGDVDVDPACEERYVIYSRVNSLSMLISAAYYGDR